MRDDLGYKLLFSSEKIIDHIPDQATRQTNPIRVDVSTGDFTQEFGRK